MRTAAPTPHFGTLLKQFRRAAGLTQEALAERARLSVRGIQNLERGVSGRPRPDTVALLAAALGLIPDEYVALEEAARRPAPSGSGPVPSVGTAAAGALPTTLTPLIGREHELAL